MSKIVTKTKNGDDSYRGFTSAEISQARNLAKRIAEEVPEIKTRLAEKYGEKSKEYVFEFGRYLSDLLAQEEIPDYERRFFWKEIKDQTTGELHDKRAGKGNNRSYLEICYLIYQEGESLASSFTWKEWNDLLGRESGSSDRRYLIWLQRNISQMTNDDFRAMLVLMTLFTNSFSADLLPDDEFFAHCDNLWLIIRHWNSLYKSYFSSKKKNLTEARQKRFAFYKRQYLIRAYKETKRIEPNLYGDVCTKVFKSLYIDVDNSANLHAKDESAS